MEKAIYEVLEKKGLHSERDIAAKEIEGLEANLDADEIQARQA